MNRKVISSTGFNTLQELITLLQQLPEDQRNYVFDTKGEYFDALDVVETKLTDGSTVTDVVLRTRRTAEVLAAFNEKSK